MCEGLAAVPSFRAIHLWEYGTAKGCGPGARFGVHHQQGIWGDFAC